MNVTSNWLEENKEEMSKRIRKEQNESCSTSVVLLMPGHRYLQTEDQQLELRRNLNVPEHAGLHELFLCSSFFFLHTLGAAAMGCYGMLWDAMGIFCNSEAAQKERLCSTYLDFVCFRHFAGFIRDQVHV